MSRLCRMPECKFSFISRVADGGKANENKEAHTSKSIAPKANWLIVDFGWTNYLQATMHSAAANRRYRLRIANECYRTAMMSSHAMESSP